MYIRQATKDDLDDIVEIHFEAFHDEPDMDYLFPHRREFPDFMKVSTKRGFVLILQSQKFTRLWWHARKRTTFKKL
jgi:hypothetical protein